MINILKADLYRLIKSKSFYFYWLAIIATYLISIVSKTAGGIIIGSVDMSGDIEVKLDIEQVARNFTFYFLFLFPVFGFITCDFGEKTIKNTISSTISRRKYFVSKFVITQFYCIGTFFVANLLFYVANAVVNGSGYSSPLKEYVKAVTYQLPLMLGTVGIFILAAFLLKKTAPFNAITIICPIIYTGIALSIYTLGQEEFATKYLLKYELGTALSHIVMGAPSEYIRNCTILGLGLMVVSFVIGYISFTRFEVE